MNKQVTITLATGILIALAIWLGYLVGGTSIQAQAAQCWEPGCCGPSLVYNQWSCESAESSNVCIALGESPTWVCNSNGFTDYDEIYCRDFRCNGQPCEWRCPLSDWGNHCVITSGNVACNHPNDNTCTANVYAIQCQSMAGVNDCNSSTSPLDTRQCWVTGGSPALPDQNV